MPDSDDREERWDHYDTAFRHPSTPISAQQWWEHGSAVPAEPDEETIPDADRY